MSLIYLWRISVALLGVLQLTQCASLILFCNDDTSLQNYVEMHLTKANELMKNSCYNNSRESAFYAFGYTGNKNGRATVAVLEALVSMKKFNIFLLNWEYEASSISVSNSTDTITKQISYVATGLAQAKNVGIQFGNALVHMGNYGLDLSATYLVGHSLGAQLIGVAGRVVIAAGLLIGWIFGLDPAGPFFGNPSVLKTLNAGDGNAVFCIHTDPGGYGINKTLCKVDLMPNYFPFTQPSNNLPFTQSSNKPVQPGCPIGDFPKFSINDLCSHDRSWMFFVEGVTNQYSTKKLLGFKAYDVFDFEDGYVNCSDTVTVELNWDITRNGAYYLHTNNESPYGLGEDGYCA